ncbi:hypothetical protein Dimus_016430 [Dionaea muscipula]
MEGKKATFSLIAEDKIIPIFSEILTRVVKLEELATVGGRLLVGFQLGIEFLRRPPIDDTSQLVQSIIKANETNKVKSYFQRGCINTHDSVQKMIGLNTFLHGLQGHLREARRLLDELDTLMNDAGNAVQADAIITSTHHQCQSGISHGSKPELAACDGDGGKMESVLPKLDAADYGSLMAVIYTMMKQDFVMQEKIISSLNLKTSASALETYCLMCNVSGRLLIFMVSCMHHDGNCSTESWNVEEFLCSDVSVMSTAEITSGSIAGLGGCHSRPMGAFALLDRISSF